ncbi:AAA family ATPase [Vibrio fluvialis]|nr:AAA family ATPase [Vibrio fluvialis]
MTTIRKIKVTGFKSILNEEVDLGKLNVFIGTNGAGKSNFLEAVSMLSASIEGGIDYDRIARRGSRLSSPQIFRSAFKNRNRRNTFTLEVSTEELKYSMSVNAVDGFSYNAESLKSIKDSVTLCGRSNNGSTVKGMKLKSKFDREKSIISLYRTLEQEFPDLLKIEDFAIYAPSTPILRGVATDNSNKSPLGLYGGRLAEALSEVIGDGSKQKDLQRFFKLLDWFKQVGTTGQTNKDLISDHVSLGRKVVSYKDKFMKVNFNDLYAYDVSEGALYILFVLVLLSHKDAPNFVALDNIDSALNPGLVRNLTSHISDIIFDNPDKQVLLTTHNPTTLDAIDLFNDEHRLFVVSRNEEGHTTIKRIEPPEGMTKEMWQEQYYGLKLSEIWLSGAIGGLTSGF